LHDPSAGEAVYFASLGGFASSTWLVDARFTPLFPNAQPLFPLETQLTGIFSAPGDSPGSAIGLQNPTSAPVTVTLELFGLSSFGFSTNVSIPPYSAALYNVPSVDTVVVSASAPLRMVELNSFWMNPTPEFSPVGLAPAQKIVAGSAPGFTWQIGTPPPQPFSIPISNAGPGLTFDYSVTASTASGGAWLNITPTKGNTAGSVSIIASVSPTGLAAGIYAGAITLTPLEGTTQPVAIPVTLTVIPANYVILPPYTSPIIFSVFGSPVLAPRTFTLTSGTPVSFTLGSSIQSGGNWFTASVSSTATPATLMVTPNAAGLPIGMYAGQIAITGPANTITITISLQVFGPPQLSVYPTSFLFSGQSGGPAPTPHGVVVTPSVPFSLITSTASGGNWLKASIVGPTNGSFDVSVNTSGLAAGTYSGTVTVSSTAAAGPVPIAVTLDVWTIPPTYTAAPASLTFTVASGLRSPPQTISVVSSDPLLLPYLNPVVNAGAGVGVFCPPAAACALTAAPLSPGTYYGELQLRGPSPDFNVQSTVAITVYALPTAAQPPVIASVVSAATQIAGSLAPGEIVALHGVGIGPPPGSSLARFQLLFDGRAAPVLYTSSSQVNAIVPFEVAGQTTTTIQVINNGVQSAAWAVAIAPSAPGIFTLNQTGVGAAAVLNQDSSVNNSANPAARGAAIQIFATGGGQTSPPSATGSITPSAPMLALPATVSIGGVNAALIYAGAAPQEIAGMIQVNAVVPQSVAPGATVPLSITIGDATSPSGVTVAIK